MSSHQERQMSGIFHSAYTARRPSQPRGNHRRRPCRAHDSRTAAPSTEGLLPQATTAAARPVVAKNTRHRLQISASTAASSARDGGTKKKQVEEQGDELQVAARNRLPETAAGAPSITERCAVLHHALRCRAIASAARREIDRHRASGKTAAAPRPASRASVSRWPRQPVLHDMARASVVPR